LAEAKRRGVQLGNPEQPKANRLEAEAHAERLRPVLTELRGIYPAKRSQPSWPSVPSRRHAVATGNRQP
jgi:hypothetical protein